MKNFDMPLPFTMEITITDPNQIQAVYAVLADMPLANIASGMNLGEAQAIRNKQASVLVEQMETAGRLNVPEETETDDPNEIDAHGHPFNAMIHTGTKTKAGLWRMKAGVSRPDPKPGFPVTTETPSETSTASPATEIADGATEQAGSLPTEEPASVAVSQEDDEFAAFRAASAKVDAAEAAAAVTVPERVWSDADLGVLCNQAAVKLGDPSPVKEVIAAFMPEGTVAHSRNVPVDRRAEFVKAIEAKAGIEFAG